MNIEIWKDIPGYEGLYQVSNLGRVKSLPKWTKTKGGALQLRKEKYLNSYISSTGYYRVHLSKDGISKQKTIHTIMSICFIPNTENKPCINHKNGIKTDNSIENLEWVTIRENTIHAYENGLINVSKGENHYTFKRKSTT
jgi:hypothetical protein